MNISAAKLKILIHEYNATKRVIEYSHDFFIPHRALDGDLQVLVKAGEEFDWERISFILEAAG